MKQIETLKMAAASSKYLRHTTIESLGEALLRAACKIISLQ
jgi:hypothetical protein